VADEEEAELRRSQASTGAVLVVFVIDSGAARGHCDQELSLLVQGALSLSYTISTTHVSYGVNSLVARCTSNAKSPTETVF
jgi:hypothetical protein